MTKVQIEAKEWLTFTIYKYDDDDNTTFQNMFWCPAHKYTIVTEEYNN